jgi:hypothetical protein
MKLAERRPVVMGADSISLDSCARLDNKSRPQGRVLQPGETINPIKAGSWSATRVVQAERFTIEVPVVVSELRIVALDRGDSRYALDGFPGCRYYCSLAVTFQHDSARAGAEAYVSRIRDEHEKAGDDAADWAPGPWHPMTVDGQLAGIVDIPCGDCTTRSVYTARADTIAEIELSIDDREGFQPGLACRLARVAQTFQWAR